ncbi:DMT family transporter [Sinimarinibacterium sp. CAU 1509]|uniref:DMT family transporter n=1 Tax=Sinimarinibacterium sp. CAU 1509 TaxID=2562283 RepID=UPI0010AD67D8|nr:DMT family transporter [Sinimarinibacterium sp. CAU 1509]TJY63092.1 DMT family transporter [Sinimarinibacterium sp. CAU 1509]
MGIGELFALGCAFTWAVAIILFKKSGEHLPPFALNLVKNAMVLPLFVATVLMVEGPQFPALPARDLAVILASGVLGIAVGDTLYFRALNAIGASRMAVAQALYSPSVIGLSMLLLGERLSLWQLCGVALVLCGIVLVSYSRAEGTAQRRALRIGVLWAVFSVFLMALGVVMAKPMLEQYSFLWVVSLRVAAGFAGMLAIAVFGHQLPALLRSYRGVQHWGAIIVGGIIGTYLSMMLWLAGYKYTQASIAAVLNELAAVFILPLAVLFLRERVESRQVIGVSLALLGVVLVVSL